MAIRHLIKIEKSISKLRKPIAKTELWQKLGKPSYPAYCEALNYLIIQGKVKVEQKSQTFYLTYIGGSKK